MPRQVIEPILITDPQRRQAVDEIDIEQLARWMDNVFVIPGTRIRFGVDAIIGLVPGLGDAITSIASMYILKVASRRGVPRVILVRMTLNLGIDYLLGSLPLIGDMFDVYWKANLKNVALIQRHALATPSEARRGAAGDWFFVAGLMAALIALLVGCVTIAYFLVTALWHLIGGT